MPMKTTFLSIVCALMAGTVHSAEPTYTHAQIDAYIQDSSAKEHGVGFDNQGMGCRTYFWRESADHHVFFFRRDGLTFGEFRDEVLVDGRFLSIHERYLVVGGRDPETLSKARELHFVCKETIPVWKSNVMVESKVRWSFLTTDRRGNTLQRGETTEKRMIRGVVSVIVPDELTPNGDAFVMSLKRSNLTLHEKAFGYGDVNPLIERFGLTNRRCSLWAQWPEDDPELIVILSKKLPTSPVPLSTKEIASMKIKLNPPQNVPFVFIPNE